MTRTLVVTLLAPLTLGCIDFDWLTRNRDRDLSIATDLGAPADLAGADLAASGDLAAVGDLAAADLSGPCDQVVDMADNLLNPLEARPNGGLSGNWIVQTGTFSSTSGCRASIDRANATRVCGTMPPNGEMDWNLSGHSLGDARLAKDDHYRATVWMRVPAGSPPARLATEEYGPTPGGAIGQVSTSATGEWMKLEAEFIAQTSTMMNYPIIAIYGPQVDGGCFDVDQVYLKKLP